MLEYLFNPLKFIPNEYETTIYDIDFKRLYDEGKRLIISDLDNTLISYREKMPTKELLDFKQKLNEMGFEIVICSNNHKKRVKAFVKHLVFLVYGVLISHLLEVLERH
jgi:predicted HAD superfamily phosphohydrolase YqeG